MMTPELVSDSSEDENSLSDRKLPSAFTELRHHEEIEGSRKVTQPWRMKERMKTVSVALVLCLNVGVDPPDVVKTSPCARLECWIDPTSTSPQKALEAIGSNLQKQYERWQPRARYKQTLDPTSEDVKKLCTTLRRNAKEERVLFHYNGHGVPRPTANGEIWVFNQKYTQYIPLSIYDLQTWMGSPSIYVYDCSNAGIIVESFQLFSSQREQESTSNGQRYNGQGGPPPSSIKNCIQLAACGANELLPMNPELPADLFTSCLSTPIKIALKWYVLQNTSKLVPNLTPDLVDRVPGQLNDRRTMLGELNWIFTAITDTIAWNTLPRELFQKLFRQDLLVASLFRNFLLAERIMRSYNCTPTSGPKLPPTYHHPMWQAWDLSLDLCLQQLPALLEDENIPFQHSPFFTEQLTAFQVWLSYGSEERSPPEQLPIVLQVLLSQVHRLRALELLSKFLDLGPWAVSLALSVGIYPYVLRLLLSSARELRHLLVFIWAKILSVDSSCQADLVKDGGYKYFLSVLADSNMSAEHRTMAAFVLSMIVNNYKPGQEEAVKSGVISTCLIQLSDGSAPLKQWLALCLGKVWTNYDDARWYGIRDQAHEKLFELLQDPSPEVRAAVVFALGTFINSGSSERTDQANSIDLTVGRAMCDVCSDGSPLVRKELVVAFANLVQLFETQFVNSAIQLMEEDKHREKTAVITAETPDGLQSSGSGMRSSSSRTNLKSLLAATTFSLQTASPGSSVESMSSLEASTERVKRSPSTNTLTSLTSLGVNSIYTNIWKTLLQLAADPFPEVARMGKNIVNIIKLRATMMSTTPALMVNSPSMSMSAPASPSNRPAAMNTSPQTNHLISEESHVQGMRRDYTSPRLQNSTSAYSTASLTRGRKVVDKMPVHPDEDETSPTAPKKQVDLSTEFFEWSCKHFAQPVMRMSDQDDPESAIHLQREFNFSRNARVRAEAADEQLRAGFSRLDDQVFVNRNQGLPSVMKFHPYDSYVAVADRDGVAFWDWENGAKIGYQKNHSHSRLSKITAMEFLNAHDDTLLMCGTEDGCVSIWRNYLADNNEKKLVTAFQAVSDMLPVTRGIGSGLVLDWEQESGMLMASGDVRSIRIWDTHSEKKILDIQTGADSCVTSLASDYVGRSLLIAGCGDGTVRLFDRRLSPLECRVMTLREHNHRVLAVHLQKGSEGKIISASHGGDIRFWDPRFTESVRCLEVQNGLSAFAIHNVADVLACGSVNQHIGVFNQSGDSLSIIKYHEGFLGQRISAITCLAFHPYKVKLAAGGSDSLISVYSTVVKRS